MSRDPQAGLGAGSPANPESHDALMLPPLCAMIPTWLEGLMKSLRRPY